MKSSNRRKRYLVESFQLSLMRRLIIILLLLLLVIGVLIFFMYRSFLVVSYESTRSHIMPQYQHLSKEAFQQVMADVALARQMAKHEIVFLTRMVIGALVMCGCLGVLSIYTTHKIAGPVYRLKRAIDRATAGDYSDKIVLRRGDFLKPLIASWNTLLDRLSEEKRR